MIYQMMLLPMIFSLTGTCLWWVCGKLQHNPLQNYLLWPEVICKPVFLLSKLRTVYSHLCSY